MTFALLLLLQAPDIAVPADCPDVALRGSLASSRLAFEGGRGRVAFLGGSITEMDGYRPRVMKSLQRRFPATHFDVVSAGIASTCSTTGAFRLKEDVLDKGPIDLLFVEFAVNDDQDAHHDRPHCIRGLEGILRQARLRRPLTDIVVTFFVNEGMLETLRNGAEPLSSACHEELLVRYEVPGIALHREVARRIAKGALTWKQYGGVHPGPDGNQLCANMIDVLLDRAWAAPGGAAPHALPEPLDPQSYDAGRYAAPEEVGLGPGWTVERPDWKSLRGTCRDRFKDLGLTCASTPGAGLTLAFEGRAAGAYLLAGPDAGAVEASVDGGPFRRIELKHAHSAGLHYPRTVMFAEELPRGPHTLRLRLLEGVARFVKLCVN